MHKPFIALHHVTSHSQFLLVTQRRFEDECEEVFWRASFEGVLVESHSAGFSDDNSQRDSLCMSTYRWIVFINQIMWELYALGFDILL